MNISYNYKTYIHINAKICKSNNNIIIHLVDFLRILFFALFKCITAADFVHF